MKSKTSKLLVGESVRTMTTIFPVERAYSTSNVPSIIYNGRIAIPSNTILEVKGIRNGYVYLHEHEVQEAEWSVLKRLYLMVVDSTERQILGQMLEMTGVAVRSCLARIPVEAQVSTYRWHALKRERGLLKPPVRHTVDV